ncbi:MAG: SDR family oxidoreductase [Pseudomonadota bacterium]
MVSHLQNKTIVITGAASGFGRLVCEKAAALGANVVGGDVSEEKLIQVVDQITEAGHQMVGQACDVTVMEQVQNLVDSAVERFGGVDVMINNAGIMPLAFYADHKEARSAWSTCIDVNIKGVLHGIMAAHDQMLDQGRGHVVNLSSIYSNFPVAGAAVYGASKAAVNFLSEALRVESQGKIKVTTIRPTGVPSTNLSSAVVNDQAIVGILGQNAAAYGQLMAASATGSLPAEHLDREHIEYFALAPEDLADQIIYAIDQPWGVVIGDVTVRASGDGYIL